MSSATPGLERLDDWWEELRAAALVGTGRRPVPSAPAWPVAAREDAPPEAVLLDAAAIGSALRRAGAAPRPPAEGAQADAALPDELPLAPARARQLLDLLLTQSPVGARLTPVAVSVWLREAARHGVRVHHATLVPLLDAATRNRDLRAGVARVLDHRGAWLAAANPAWRWAVAVRTAHDAPGEVDVDAWRRLPTEQRAVQVRTLRRADPAPARTLLESTWQSDPATARATFLAALEEGLSLDDEPLLERALDDRAPAVREMACRLLDGLPGSARAGRLRRVLGPLLSRADPPSEGVRVELPAHPAPAAVRDGLGAAPPGRSQRGLWLERLAAGAPFETWTESTGLDPDRLVSTLREEDALLGLRTAAVARRDAAWARALLDRGWDPGLVRCLPDDEMTARVRARVDQVATLADLVQALRLVPGPWPESLSAAVVVRLARLEHVPSQLPGLVAVLAEGLSPSAAPAVRRLAASGTGGPTDPFHQLAHHLALVATLQEAFT